MTICPHCGQTVKAAKPKAALNLDAQLPKRNAKWPVGEFVAKWEDGSETKVSGVVYKPGEPWPFAFQAADSLRRLRAAPHWPESGPARPREAQHVAHPMWVKGPCGVQYRAQAYWDLVRTKPMPALVEIEGEGERYSVW